MGEEGEEEEVNDGDVAISEEEEDEDEDEQDVEEEEELLEEEDDEEDQEEVDEIDVVISEEEGCCAGDTEKTTVLCSLVDIEDHCKMMGPCGWISGAEADCSWKGESQLKSAKFFVFGGGSSITNVMDTQLNFTSLISVVLAATVLHSIYRCWNNRRRSKKGTLNGRRQSEFNDDNNEEEESDEGEGIPDDESMYFQYV